MIREITAGDDFRNRTAALSDFTPEVMEAFAEGFVMSAGLRDMGRKLKRIWQEFKRQPRIWDRIKKFLGVEGLTDLPGAIKEWAKRGVAALRKLVSRIAKTFPLSMFTVPKGKLPGLTDMIARIIERSPKLKAALASVNTNIVQPLDRLIEKHLPTLGRPIKAAIFIWIWLHVAEISWDFAGIAAGFTGAITIGELFGSLPESAIGLVFALAGVGYHLLPVMLVARILWLVASRFIEWVPGKGFKVHWDRITGERERAELVPAV